MAVTATPKRAKVAPPVLPSRSVMVGSVSSGKE